MEKMKVNDDGKVDENGGFLFLQPMNDDFMLLSGFGDRQTTFVNVELLLRLKNCSEGDIGPYRREGGKRYPFFSAYQKGDIFLWREGSKYF